MSQPEIPTKPYFIRALHEWCTDNGYTPYLEVRVNANTRVPAGFVKDGSIVLNVGYTATRHLKMDNDWITFSARFGGVSHEIVVPVGAVASLFAKESGEGMAFEVQLHDVPATAPAPQPSDRDEPPPGPPAGGRGGHLKVVK